MNPDIKMHLCMFNAAQCTLQKTALAHAGMHKSVLGTLLLD